MFRGREMAHQDLGLKLLRRIEQDLQDYGTVEQFPKMEGRVMVMVLAPRKDRARAKQKAEQEAVGEGQARG